MIKHHPWTRPDRPRGAPISERWGERLELLKRAPPAPYTLTPKPWTTSGPGRSKRTRAPRAQISERWSEVNPKS